MKTNTTKLSADNSKYGDKYVGMLNVKTCIIIRTPYPNGSNVHSKRVVKVPF